MTLRNTSTRYGSLAIALHWAMLLLIALVYLCIEMRGYFPKGSATRDALKTWHFMLGSSVFVLATVRLIVHLADRAPAIRPAPARWQRIASSSVHLLLYGFMLVMPVLGWLLLGSEGRSVPFFGLQLPVPMGESAALAGQLEEIHETIGSAGYALIGLHAAAAIFHHVIRRDDTLRRMLPWPHHT
jgi:cytochrome b561